MRRVHQQTKGLAKEHEKDDLFYHVHQRREVEPGWDQGSLESTHLMDYGMDLGISARLTRHHCKRIELTED